MRNIWYLLFWFLSINAHTHVILPDGSRLDTPFPWSADSMGPIKDLIAAVDTQIEPLSWFFFDREHHIFFLPNSVDCWDFSKPPPVLEVVVSDRVNVLYPLDTQFENLVTKVPLLDLGLSQTFAWLEYKRYGDWCTKNRVVIKSLKTMLRQFFESFRRMEEAMEKTEQPHEPSSSYEPSSFVEHLSHVEQAVWALQGMRCHEIHLTPHHVVLTALWLYSKFQDSVEQHVGTQFESLHKQNIQELLFSSHDKLIEAFGHGKIMVLNSFYDECVPVFTMNGTLGLNTSDFGILHEVIPVGFSLNPYPMHIGNYRRHPYRTTEHDYHHGSALDRLNIYHLGRESNLRKDAIDPLTGKINLNLVEYGNDKPQKYLLEFRSRATYRKIYYGIFSMVAEERSRFECLFCLWYLIHEVNKYLPFEHQQYQEAVAYVIRKEIFDGMTLKISHNEVVNELFNTFDLMKLITKLFDVKGFEEFIERVHEMMADPDIATRQVSLDYMITHKLTFDDLARQNIQLGSIMSIYFQSFYDLLYRHFPIKPPKDTDT